MISKDRSLIGANKLSDKLTTHNLVKLARDAGIDLLPKEQYLLEWVSDTKHGFFHELDYPVTLTSARERFRMLDAVFNRAKKSLPHYRRKVKYGVVGSSRNRPANDAGG